MAAEGGAGGFEQVGIIQSIIEGGIVSISTALILVIMSVASWYIFFVKMFEQSKIIRESRKVRTAFWGAPNIKEGANRLDKNGAYRQIVDDGLRAEEQHDKLTNPIDQHDWMLGSLARSQGAIASRLGRGLALLATVGSTAPFIGLFGTVVGIYGALLSIGASGQASIQAVAAPVGEALIQTALGLAVAVPAVMQYNWLMRRNKAIAEDLGKFTNDLHGYMMSEGKVKPQVAAAPARPTAGAPTGGGRPTGPGGTGGAGGPGAGGPGAASGAGTGATTRPTSGGPSISKA
jgi:biopolymer transport protein ExbB